MLLIAYSNGKLSYLSILRWREVVASRYSCSLLCCWGTVAQPRAERAVTYILQLPVVQCATSLAELICENEELFIYPAPLTRSYITFGLKCAQGISLFFAIIGFLVLCRAASIVSPRTSPFLKLIFYKSIYILSAVQGHALLYLAFYKILPAVSDIAPVTRAIVWANFFTITECTFAYFIAIKLYKVKEYTEIRSFKSNLSKTLEKVESRDAFYRASFEGEKKRGSLPNRENSDGEASASTPELELDQQDLVNLKLLGLKVKLPAEVDETLSLSSLRGQLTLSSDEDAVKCQKGKLKKGAPAFRSVDTMLDPTKNQAVVPKSALLVRGDKSATIGYAKLPIKEQDEEDRDIEPKISIVDGKVNIALSSRDLVKLCKSSANTDDVRNSIPISLSLENEKLSDDDSVSTQEDREAHVPNPLPREKNRVKFEETDPKNRHSMQFVKSFSYTQLNSSDGESENEGLCELEHSNSRTITDPSHPQYVSKISLV